MGQVKTPQIPADINKKKRHTKGEGSATAKTKKGGPGGNTREARRDHPPVEAPPRRPSKKNQPGGASAAT